MLCHVIVTESYFRSAVNSTAFKVLTSSLTMGMEAVTHDLHCIAHEVTVRPHMPSSSQIQRAYCIEWKVEWEAQTGMCQCLTFTSEDSCGHVVLDMPESREMTEQIDWWAKQPGMSSGLWFGRHTIERPEERGLEEKKLLTVFLERKRKGHMVSQLSIGVISKATLWKPLRDRVESVWVFPSMCIPSWTELNQTAYMSDWWGLLQSLFWDLAWKIWL